tara:strand:+ start:32 stop:1876 length:1845 start_codon:yes stop_codon:yes gene_type:complete
MTAYVYTSGGFPSAPTSGDSLFKNGAFYDWTGATWKIRRATPLRSEFIATANQATKTGLTYFVGSIDCYINGAKMLLGTDFTATNGTSVTFTPALDLDDEVQLIMGVSASVVSGTNGTNGTDGAGSVANFVASGVLPNGVPVNLKADGTIEAVSLSLTSVSESIPAGSEAVFNSDLVADVFIAFDPNTAGKFVVAYSDGGNSYYGTVIVGTVSGTTLSFGAEYLFNSGGASSKISVAFDPNTAGKFVVAHVDSGNSQYGTTIVGTVSGTTVSFGAEYVFNNSACNYTSIAFDPNTSGKFVVAYMDTVNSNYGTTIVGTISGTNISFGAESVFNSGTSYYNSISFDPNTAGKFVVAYQDASNGNYGTAVVGTVSGTSISFGSEYVFNSGGSTETSVAFDPNTVGNFVVAYIDTSNSTYATAVVGTLSGTTISFGSEYVFNSSAVNYLSPVAFDPNVAGKFVVGYRDTGNSDYGTAILGTISGTSISFGAKSVFNSGLSTYNSVAFDPNTNGKFVIAHRDGGNSNYGTAIVGQLAATVSATNLTTTSFIGISTQAYTDGQTAKVTLPSGLSLNQTGLTVGATYYVQTDGTLDTTADNPSVEVGKALSATSILLKGI